eukprot:TRINITY_DN5910_c0_g2_i1.p1 TRINITY_DN5910_c0_g2~~TRINITY_DN5910_c0_g2_i1.p1  ORF type:complete len:267 (-),score=92.76 TRINITY_DN5910_c0_g2_i1:80-880(-)
MADKGDAQEEKTKPEPESAAGKEEKGGEEEEDEEEEAKKVAHAPSRALLMQQFMNLQQKANVARQMNHHELVREEERSRDLPPEEQAKKYRYEQSKRLKRKHEEISKASNPAVAVLDVSAEAAEKSGKKKRTGESFGWQVFDDESQSTVYDRRIASADRARGLATVRAEYAEQKQRLGESVYATANSMIQGVAGQTVKPENLDRLVTELDKAKANASVYSRRRAFYEGADITYINERNRNFNRKIARAYDDYTAEIRQNLERGTAL